MMLQDFWGARTAGARLREIALELGSDVPFFLGAGSAEASGRGEVLSYFELALPFAILVCTPPVQVSTARAYRAVTPDDDGSRRSMREELIGALEEPGRLQETLRNDFESPVCAEFPVIAGARQSLLAAGAACASLSGSGSSVFGLFPERESAEKAAVPLRSSGMRTHITPPGFRG
jgi:4-diphosphocytidyl-2-C-methyl-D-erythritol kinase